MNSKIFKITSFGILFLLLNACGDKKVTADLPIKVAAESKSSVRYLGLRLLDLPDAGPYSLEKEFKECIFEKDDTDWPVSSKACRIKDLAPTFKERPDESIEIESVVVRSGVISATISPNQLSHENTLRIFDNISGVEKSPFKCNNLEPDSGQRDFFVVAQNGSNKFTIQEDTDGGSGGSQTTTTIYFWMNTPDCANLEQHINQREKKIRDVNIANANNKSNNKNILFDSKTGVSLNKESKNWNEGACTAVLSVMIDKGELTAEKNTEAQNAWIRTRGQKGREIASKFASTKQGTTIFEMFKMGLFTLEETEFFAAFLQYRSSMAGSDIASRALVQMKVCGDAGFSPRL